MASQLETTVAKVLIVGQGDAACEFNEWIKGFSFIEPVEADRMNTLISRLRVAYIGTMFRTHDEMVEGQKQSVITRRADINWQRDDMMAMLARENLLEACNRYLVGGITTLDDLKPLWIAYVKCHKDDPAEERAALAELAGMGSREAVMRDSMRRPDENIQHYGDRTGKPVKQASPTKPATGNSQPRVAQSGSAPKRQPAAKPAASNGKSSNGSDYTSEAIMARLFGGQKHVVRPVAPASYIKGGHTPETHHPVVATQFDIVGASQEERQAWFDEIHSSGYCFYQVHQKGEWLPIPSSVPVRNRQREALLAKQEQTLIVEQPHAEEGKGVPIEEMRRLKEEMLASKKKRGKKK